MRQIYFDNGSTFFPKAPGVSNAMAELVEAMKLLMKWQEWSIITGGISHSTYFCKVLSRKLMKKVEPTTFGRYAGALGAALLAEEKTK